MLTFSTLAIAAVLFMGVISLGPRFIYVARNAIIYSHLHDRVTALGTGIGAAIFSLVALFGLQKILNAVQIFFYGFECGGGMLPIVACIENFQERIGSFDIKFTSSVSIRKNVMGNIQRWSSDTSM
nr:LysE family transporter [Pantoea agglomerans]